ncbi:cytosine permease [Protaetiibacter larvae]|uniref:Cytosine permease n=1 Tax=Protaetiibacter larvae TaxID=2592654 RepID=A0A5C1YBE2_9MICO|nr:cytosine permease [Protaetiibacter larvae]QEO10212.1 hypothetical protein FLP23_09445 [Protaetiibacter larvae]
MTDVPPSSSGRPHDDDPDAAVGQSGAQQPAAYPPPYPPPYGGDIVSDDELASALAAQTAMYTGPITLPVLNSDPVFQPDPAELQLDVPPPVEEEVASAQGPAAEAPPVQLPPVPIPPPVAPPEYVAPDAIAADPEPPTIESPSVPAFVPEPVVPEPVGAQPFVPEPVVAPPFVSEPIAPEPVAQDAAVPDDAELGRTVEQEAAAGSTLDAILLLENELRRRQGLPVVEEAPEPPAGVSAVFPETPPAFAPIVPPPSHPEPVYEQPGYEQPVYEQPVYEQPVYEQPVYEQPVYEQPVYEQPAYDESGYVQPVFTDAEPDLASFPPPIVDPNEYAAPYVPESPLPGWTPAPDPEREGATPSTLDGGLESDERLWLAAPPPSFEPPPLVEPPAPQAAPLDPSTLTPTPVPTFSAPVVPPPLTTVDGPDGPVDVTRLPPPTGVTAIEVPPATFLDAPPPDVDVLPFAAPPAAPPTAAPVSFDALVAPPPGDAETDGIDDLAHPGAGAVPADSSLAPVTVTSSVAEVAVEPVPIGDDPDAARDPSPGEVEAAAAEPTPLERRAGHAARMFWLWFAANSSIVMVAVGASIFGFGLSLRQALVAIVAGVAVSALPLGLGTLAGKWSGQPTLVVSRASFGLQGNLLPAILAVLGRALWGGVMIWLLAATTASLLASSGLDAGLGAPVWAIVALAIGVIVTGVVAVFGYGLLHRIQRVLGILSILLVIATVVLTAGHVDFAAALRTDDGPWALAIGGIVVVFSVVGLAWAQSSSDLARYQRPGGSGAANMLWGSFGVIVPTLLILGWGAVLAASDPELADGLASDPLVTLLTLVPSWFALPVLAASAFGLVSAAIVTVYSGGLALVATGVRTSRPAATLMAALLVAAIGGGLLALGADTRDILRDVSTTLAVPVAAWVGIFASEMMIRLRRFHAPSLLAPGGVYPAVRWVNLIGLVVISAVGFGFTSAELAGFDWQGYLFGLVGIGADDPLAHTDLGVLVALALGVILPLLGGIPAIRRQERPIDQAEQRADALLD